MARSVWSGPASKAVSESLNLAESQDMSRLANRLARETIGNTSSKIAAFD